MLIKKFRIVNCVIISITIMTLMLAGCTISQKPLTDQTNPNQGQNEGQQGQTQTPGTGGQALSTPGVMVLNSDVERAKRISQQIIALGNVKKAPVVIDGKRCMVGLQLTDNTPAGINSMINTINNQKNTVISSPDITGITSAKEPGTPGTGLKIVPNNTAQENVDIKDVIAQRVRTIDPSITQVFVVTDSTMIGRLQRLSNVMTTEINDIANKVKPIGEIETGATSTTK